MNRLRKNFVAPMILASVFMTGCDAGNILEVVQKVAEGIQRAIPAVKEVIDTISQAVNPNGNNTAANNNPTTNTTRNNPVAEQNEQNAQNAQAGVNIPSAGDEEALPEGGQGPATSAEIPQAGTQEALL
jgi:hypothetical protein